MELKPKDSYRTECSFSLSDSMMQSLVILYQPLITPEALVVYLTLQAEAGRTVMETHSRLFALTGISADVFDRACAKLEEYMLLRRYVREAETKNSYIYVLNAPMNPKDFMSSALYMNRYTKVLGIRQAESSALLLKAHEVSTQGYRDITRTVRHMPEEHAMDKTVEYVTVKPRNNFLNDDSTIVFDYEKFIATTSSLVFPVELRTQENLYLIGKLATVYGLGPDRMRVLVKDCVNLATMEFDGEKLRLKASREKPEQTTSGDPYSLAPVSFLQSKQNGAQVSRADQKILEHLAMDMHFPSEVINVMIEYILSVSSNRLHPNFVDMVAGEWARDGVQTKEQALLETKKKIRSAPSGKQSSVVVPLPEIFQKPLEENSEAEDSRDMIEKIRSMQEKISG